MKSVVLSLAFSVAAVCTLFAEAPQSPSQVPSYPGSKLVSETQSPTKDELASGKAPTFVFRLERISSSSASVEQIAQFYAGRLGASIEQEGGADPNDLAPGQVSTVASTVEYYDADFIDQSPDAVKAAFEKRPRLPQADGWARIAAFSWAFKSAGNDAYSFTLTITDKSVSEDDPRRYNPSTEIALSVSMLNQEKLDAFQADMTKNAAAAQQAPGKGQPTPQQAPADAASQGAAVDKAMAAMEADQKRLQAELAKAPTERDLGVAIYPGARYNAEVTMNQSMFLTDKTRVYVFEVEARPDVVGRFYEKKTGNKNLSIAPNLIFIPINFGKASQQGDNPPPRDCVAIGSKTADGPCVLMITKRPPGWTGQEGAGK